MRHLISMRASIPLCLMLLLLQACTSIRVMPESRNGQIVDNARRTSITWFIDVEPSVFSTTSIHGVPNGKYAIKIGSHTARPTIGAFRVLIYSKDRLVKYDSGFLAKNSYLSINSIDGSYWLDMNIELSGDIEVVVYSSEVKKELRVELLKINTLGYISP